MIFVSLTRLRIRPAGWYYTDDVYGVYDGGYYMYDVVHPGIRISVNII